MVYGVVAAVLAGILVVRVIGGHSGMRKGDLLIAVMALAAATKFLLLVGVLDVTVARVLTETSTVATFVVGMEMLRTWWSGPTLPNNAWWTWFWRISTALVLLAVASVTLLNADTLIGVAAKGEQPVFASAAVMAFRYIALGAWVALLATVMLVLVTRFALHTPPGAVRQALLLVAGCEASFAAYGVLWLMQGLTDPTALISPWADVALTASRVGALFIAAAFLRVSVGRLPTVRRWSDRRALTALRPLWMTLRPLDPDASLIDELPATTRRMSSADLEWTLWRVMLEVREWLDHVAARLPDGAYTAALQASRDAGGSDTTARAAAGQVWIEAGLDANHDVSDGRDHPPVGDDLDEELAQLLLLVKPLTRRDHRIADAARQALADGQSPLTSQLPQVHS